ncbi:MAG: hypothetical protein QMC83_07060 [Thermodesulfovibrionales bacterium]|nr:hypothetical protein [Thermodesulfovibrionales bacterium]
MIRNYISRKLLEKEEYYRYGGEYFPFLEESPFDLYSLIVKETKKIIILGDAGYGKSTELKNVFSKFVEEENPDFIPIFIELNTYTDEDIEDYIKLKIGKDSEPLLNNNLAPKFVFLFDEFDQVMDKGKAERKIKNFMEKYIKSTFIIACRTNFYTGQFEDFKIFVLLPFNSEDIKEYTERILGNERDYFLQQLDQYSLLDLVKNPFFLSHLIEIFQTDKRIPGNRTDIFSRIISHSLEKDETKLKDKYDLKRTYPTSEIEKDLMYVSIIMENLQRNFISIEEFNKIISDTKKRQVIPELSLFKKSFFKQGDVYQFQHNNFQEFLAAKKIAYEKLNTILKFISFAVIRRLSWLEKIVDLLKYIEFKPLGIKTEKVAFVLLRWLKDKKINRINPSWINTVAFLCQLRQENDLFEYLVENEPELSLKFEVNRIDEEKREKLFKIIFDKYTKRKIPIDRDRIDYDEMANFAKTKKIYDYLSEFARSKEHHMYRLNSIYMLGRMKELADKSLYNLLIQYAKNEDENSGVRHLCLYTLVMLRFTDYEIIESLRELENSNDEMVLAAFYYLIKESAFTDRYVDILLNGIKRVRESTLLDVKLNISQGIEKVKSIDGIKKIIDHFIKNPKELREYYLERSIDQIIKNVAKVYETDSSIYDDIKKLVIILYENHMRAMISKFVTFFEQTKTTFRLFKEIYVEGIGNNYPLLARIADEKCINFLIDEYQKNKLSEDNIQIFINFLSSRNRDDFNRLIGIINEKTGKFHMPPPKDFARENKEKLQRKIQIIFDKNEFIKEVEKIFDGEGIKELSYEDLEHIWDEEKYNDFVIQKIINYFEQGKDKKWTFDSLKKEINNWDYEWFTITHTFDFLYHGTELELSEEQKTLIKDFCSKNIGKVDFKNSLKQEDKTTTANTLATILWYFLRRFDLDYPREILLDMLSFDWIEASKYVGIDYLINRLLPEDVKDRILKNLQDGISINQVLKNHVSYCKKNRVLEAKESLHKIVKDSKIEIENRLLALETLVDFGESREYIEKLLEIEEPKLFIEVARVLISLNSEKCRTKLIENLNLDKKDILLDSAKLLIEKEQNLKAIKYYANYIKRTKQYETTFRGKSILQTINTIKALPILFDLLKFSYTHKQDINQDEFDRLDSAIINVLKNIALQSYSNLEKVLKELKEFIKKYDTQLEGLNFLDYICDDIEKAFFANYPTRLTLEEAKNKVDNLLKINT